MTPVTTNDAALRSHWSIFQLTEIGHSIGCPLWSDGLRRDGAFTPWHVRNSDHVYTADRRDVNEHQPETGRGSVLCEPRDTEANPWNPLRKIRSHVIGTANDTVTNLSYCLNLLCQQMISSAIDDKSDWALTSTATTRSPVNSRFEFPLREAVDFATSASFIEQSRGTARNKYIRV